MVHADAMACRFMSEVLPSMGGKAPAHVRTP